MEPIDVTVITGFLGSGKTTLINRLLADPALRDTAVIVNEFGEIAIDHLLVEQSGEDVIEIAGGCLCCTVRGELVETLTDLIDRLQAGKIGNLSRIIIETTGMADPIPVLHAIQSHPALMQALRIDRVIATADAVAGLATLQAHEEARRQIAVADLIVITKSDLAGPDDASTLKAEIAKRTSAPTVTDTDIDENATQLLEMDVLTGSSRSTAPDEGNNHRHGTAISSHVVSHHQPVPWQRVEAFLDMLRSRPDADILRIKGIVETQEEPDAPIVVHGVQRLLYPPRKLESWPVRATRGTTIVIIGTGLVTEELDRMFKAFLDLPQFDTPDRDALENNPLAIPGMS